jgi:hypothetical protein
MTTTFERVQLLLRPDQKKELARRARESKKSMAEITRQLLDTGIQKAREDDEFARTREFITKAAVHRKQMPEVTINMANFINQIRDEHHD